MDSYKKERSSKQHLKIDNKDKETGGLLLMNPMACESSPTNTLLLTESPSQQSGLSVSVSIGQISRSSERSSFKSKARSKSPSLFKFFQRGGGSRKVSAEEEDDYANSSSSDHEDPFSPHSTHTTHQPDFVHTNKHTESPKSSSSSIEHYVTLPRKHKRKSPGQRDSGFSSERDSISQVKEDKDSASHSQLTTDGTPLSPVDGYRPGGMEALEMLHNQLQILVKQESGDDLESENNVYDQVIAGLSRQLEDMANSLDCLRQSDHNLRLSLRLAEQRAMEAESKLIHSQDRCQRVEQRYMKLASKYQSLARRHREMERIQQKSAVLHQMERASAHSRNGRLPQRVHSQNQYDRQHSEPLVFQRPSTAQGMHPTQQAPTLSHTETCV